MLNVFELKLYASLCILCFNMDNGFFFPKKIMDKVILVWAFMDSKQGCIWCGYGLGCMWCGYDLGI